MNSISLDLDHFHVRPSIQSDESWPAFLTRFASENGIYGIPALAKILNVRSNALLCSSPTGNDAQPQILMQQIGQRARIGSPLAWGRSWNTRVCPHCFGSTFVYGRMSWEHPLQLRCPEHQCMLVDKCPDCGEFIQHNRKCIDKCNCGRKFSSIATTTVPAWVMSMEIAFNEAFFDTQKDKVSVIAKDAARLLKLFALCKEDPDNYSKRSICDWTGMVLSDSFDLLKECFHDSWTGMPTEFMRKIESHQSKKLHYAYPKRKIAQFKHINDLVTALRRRCERPGVIRGPLSGMLRSPNRWMTQLSPIIGLSHYEIRVMVDKGLFPEVQRELSPKTGRMQTLINAEKFAQIEVECQGLPTVAYAANSLSVSASTVRHLVEMRLLGDKTKRPAYLGHLLGRDDLKEFHNFLGSCSDFEQDLPADKKTYLGSTLDEIVNTHPESGVNKLFDALESNDLSLYTASFQPKSLGDYYFDREVITYWKKDVLQLSL